jgi:uncharacterized membrane protein YqhA
MKRLELFIEGIIPAWRWLLVIFHTGLNVALALYAAGSVSTSNETAVTR